MSNGHPHWIVKHAKQYILTGIITVIPIWVTLTLVQFLLQLLAGVGAPFVGWFASTIQSYVPWLADMPFFSTFQWALAIGLVLSALYVLGWMATVWIGRKAIDMFDALMERIPLIKTVYSSIKQLLGVLQQEPSGVQRVVMIDFPSAEMKTVGLATRSFKDAASGRDLVAVYVPTTPNPTSGYLEIVPKERVTSTDWSVDEAMAFIISGGAVAPDKIHYDQPTSVLESDSTP